MKLQLLSDLHLDFLQDKGAQFIAALNPTGVDVLVLAGDLAEAVCPEYGTMLRSLCAKYPHVVMVSGNHDFYFSTPDKVGAIRKSMNTLIPNLHWLEDEIWEHQGHRFVGACMWFREDHLAFWHESSLADFKVIKNFKPWVYDKNADTRRFLESRIEPGDIVVTHHLPSQQSVSPRFRGSALNTFFVCDMESTIERTKPSLWLHGHTHDGCDYTAGSANTTRVVCNPKGYPRERRSEFFEFNPKLVLEI